MSAKIRIITVGFVLSIAALLTLVPILLDGYPNSHSSHFNVPWTVGFLGQLFDGNLYPRWLYNFPGGVGSPVFYFYAPLPFYMSAIGHFACPGCGVVGILIFSHWLGYFLSGLAFYLWARSISGFRPALYFSIIYIFLPYHLAEISQRGAVGEVLAYVFIPLLMIHVNKLATSNRSLVLAALFYAGLITSHLPSALLFSFAWVIFGLAGASKVGVFRMVSRSIYAGLLGAGLSAIYVFPALNLRQYVLEDGWVKASGVHFLPENNLFFSGGYVGSFLGFMLGSWLAQTAAAVLCIIVIVGMLRAKTNAIQISDQQKSLLIGAAVTMGFCWFMMTNPSRIIWLNFELIRQVQFPWRLGIILDFASLAIILLLVELRAAQVIRAGFSTMKPAIILIGIIGLLYAGMSAKLIRDGTIVNHTFEEYPSDLALSLKRQSDRRILEGFGTVLPVEYHTKWVAQSDLYLQDLPSENPFGDSDTQNAIYKTGYTIGYGTWVDAVNQMPDIGLAIAPGQGGLAAIDFVKTGRYKISLTTPKPTTAFIRMTYFPHWVLTDAKTGKAINISPRKTDGLIGFEIPVGKHDLVLSSRWLSSEIIGAITSLLSLLIGFALLFRARKAPNAVG